MPTKMKTLIPAPPVMALPIVAILLLCAFLTPVLAQTRVVGVSSIFGQVDVAVAIAFHPQMDFYYSREKMFTYEFDRSISRGDLAKKFESMMKERNRTIVEATNRINQMQDALAKHHQAKMQKNEELRRKLNVLRAEMNAALGRAKTVSETQRIEADFRGRTDAAEKEFADFSRQIDKKLETMGELYELEKRKVRITTFSDPDRQQEHFERISKEVEEAVRKAAETRRVSIVFNGTVLREKSAEKGRPKSDWRAIAREDQASRFGSASLNASDFLLEGLDKYRNRISRIGDYTFKFRNDPLMNNVFLVGGTDLTPDVIRLLHEKHGFKPAEIDSIVGFYEELLRSTARKE